MEKCPPLELPEAGMEPEELAARWGVKYRECQVSHDQLVEFINHKNRQR
jgi:hypothetical protein